MKTDIKSKSFEEISQELISLKQPKFRAKQVFEWLHKSQVESFEEMTNLPKDLKNILAETYYISNVTVKNKLESQIDGTVKFLYKLWDGEYVETVLMKYKHGNSICVSTQVGCKMGCEFCASTKAGFIRNLTAGEILSQIYKTQKELNLKISNIVLMGIGEPLDNYDNVVRFLSLINSENGENISMRNISLSTCGLVDKIDELAKLKLGVTLSVSLHASDDTIRSKIMPVNRKWNIDKLLKACKHYTDTTKRRISFEYALIKGENDNIVNAKALAQILKGQLCHVNLIPVNYVKEAGFKTSDRKSVEKFQKVLMDSGINTTIRRTLGSDISAACGQLRRDNLE